MNGLDADVVKDWDRGYYLAGLFNHLNPIIIHSKYFPDSDWLKALV